MKEFERCIKKRYLIKINVTKEMIQKEISTAEYDLNRSIESNINEDYKWASVQAYYSMFHAAKSLVLKKGYREKSHYCLLIALKELYLNQGLINQEMVDNFELCMHLRHDADYGLLYDQESARTAIKYAEVFLKKTLKIL